MDKDKKHVYHVGDTVRIVEPRFIERVGYPLVWTMLIEEFTAKLPMLREAMKDLIITESEDAVFKYNKPMLRAEPDAVDKDFIKGVCMAAVRMRNFGGDVRSLHYHTDLIQHDSYAGFVFRVMRKRTVKTGTRFAEKSWRSYEGEYDYEPGGLADEQTHVLLRLDNGLEIEACNVVLEVAVEPMFYIRNTKAVVGNSVLWWVDGGHGYTCDLRKAWKVPLSKARDICAMRLPKEDFMVPAKKAEAITELHVDSQLLPRYRRLGAKAKRLAALDVA